MVEFNPFLVSCVAEPSRLSFPDPAVCYKHTHVLDGKIGNRVQPGGLPITPPPEKHIRFR